MSLHNGFGPGFLSRGRCDRFFLGFGLDRLCRGLLAGSRGLGGLGLCFSLDRGSRRRRFRRCRGFGGGFIRLGLDGFSNLLRLRRCSYLGLGCRFDSGGFGLGVSLRCIVGRSRFGLGVLRLNTGVGRGRLRLLDLGRDLDSVERLGGDICGSLLGSGLGVGSRFGSQFGRIALDEDAFFTHLDLNRTRTTRGIRLADFRSLPTCQRDLLAVGRAMRAAQRVEQFRLVAVGDGIVDRFEVNAGRTQLIQQHVGRHFQLGSELGDSITRH
ncbi:translation initiation factor IF-2 domain protein [Bordetella holmesii 35009]|nr:translation initiation factor IF-2 domain protein [Bordetella holmesii 35009]